MIKYITRYYILPIAIQLLLISGLNFYLYDKDLFFFFLKAQFIQWTVAFVFLRTVFSVFVKQDVLSTTIGFVLASAFVWYNTKQCTGRERRPC